MNLVFIIHKVVKVCKSEVLKRGHYTHLIFLMTFYFKGMFWGKKVLKAQ